MTDDIVTRLRDIASLRGPMAGNVIPVACTEAADEVERLRLILTHICDVWGSDLLSIIEEINRFKKEIK